MKSKEEIEQLAKQYIEDNTGDHYVYCGYIDGYTQCQEDISKEPFNNFHLRLKRFVSNVQVNDLMSEEEKEMIIHVCNEKLNKQD